MRLEKTASCEPALSPTAEPLTCRFDGRLPGGDGEAGQEAAGRLGAGLVSILKAYQEAMESRKLREGAFHALAASREGNAFFQASRRTALATNLQGGHRAWPPSQGRFQY